MSNPSPPDPMSDNGQAEQQTPRDASPYQAQLNRAAQEDRQSPSPDRASSANPFPDFRAHWHALSARQRLRVKQGLLGLATLMLAYGLYTASSPSKNEAATKVSATKLEMGTGLRGDSLETKLHGDFQQIREGQQQLAERITAIEEGKISPTAKPVSGAHDTGELPPALPDLEIPASPPVAGRSRQGERSELDSLPPPPANMSVQSTPPAPPAPPQEKSIGAIGSATSSLLPAAADGSSAKDRSPNGAKKKTRTIFLPPGFMKARLLTGIDAMASRDATQNPEPLIARVQAPAVLPNDVKANLSGCFVIGNATGSLAKERVEVQLVSLSCVDFDEHSVIDQPVKGFFVDTDGKKGLSGKVVTRAGAALARTFLAGAASGFASAVEGSFGSTSTSALGSIRTLNAGDAAKSSLAGGISKSSDKLSDFYLDLARQAGPIVEVGAAKDVVVVIQEGVTLDIKPAAGERF